MLPIKNQLILSIDQCNEWIQQTSYLLQENPFFPINSLLQRHCHVWIVLDDHISIWSACVLPLLSNTQAWKKFPDISNPT